MPISRHLDPSHFYPYNEGNNEKSEDDMRLDSKLPEYITGVKVYEWTETTPYREQIFVETFNDVVKGRCNWVLCMLWCYVRTQGFTNACMKDWDCLNYGGKYKTLRDGIQDAVVEFLKYEVTDNLKEQKEVERLYKEIDDFCKGIIYTEPHPLPEEPKPVPVPVTTPVPLPVPVPKKLDWRVAISGILIVIPVIADYLLPGYAQFALDVVIKLVKVLMGL
jgi:hypothetical protein